MASISLAELKAKNVEGDIINKYEWSIGTNIAKDQVSKIIMKEYQQTVSALSQQVTYWANQAAGATKTGLQFNDPYTGLYIADPTDQKFEFPFLENYHHTISNNWGSNKGPIGEVVQNTIVPAAKVIKPNAGIEPPKAWEGSSSVSYTFKFYLLNTTAKKAWEDNKKLVDRLILANLQNRLNSVASEPPVFYKIEIPGVRFSPAAIISNLTVTNEGQLNRINNQSIPDAYGLIFNIQELISESRQIFTQDPIVNAAIIDSDLAIATSKNLEDVIKVYTSKDPEAERRLTAAVNEQGNIREIQNKRNTQKSK